MQEEIINYENLDVDEIQVQVDDVLDDLMELLERDGNNVNEINRGDNRNNEQANRNNEEGYRNRNNVGNIEQAVQNNVNQEGNRNIEQAQPNENVANQNNLANNAADVDNRQGMCVLIVFVYKKYIYYSLVAVV